MSGRKRELGAARALAQRVLDNESVLQDKLEPDSKTLDAIQRYHVADSKKGGCPGCRRNRLLGWLATEVRQLTGPEKTVVREVVDKTT